MLVTSPRKELQDIILTMSVYLANILVFYSSAIRRHIDLKCIQDTYRVVLNSLKQLTFR